MKVQDWSPMIEELREALDRTAAELTRHEQALTSPLLTSDLSHEHQTSWQRALERFAEKLEDFRGQVEQADDLATETDAGLARLEQAVRSFQDRLREVRQSLAEAVPKF